MQVRRISEKNKDIFAVSACRGSDQADCVQLLRPVQLNTVADDERPSIRAIASARGVSPSTVLRHIQATEDYQPDADGMVTVSHTMGRDGKMRPDRRTDTRERDKQIRKLHKAKVPMRAIATEVGCSVGTVHRVIRKG